LVSGTNGTADTPPPSTLIVTNVQSGSITTSSSQVVWTTNVPANSSVDYGTTTAYGTSTPVDSTMVTSHQVTLSGLAAGTTYFYQVNSTDSKSNHGHGGNKFNTVGFSISGAITPATGGSGATLTLSGAASATTTANSAGNYTFAGLANGTYTIAPSHAGFTFTPSSQSMPINGGNVAGVNFADTAQTFSISGTISPTAGGSGATVMLAGATTATTTANSSGAYTFIGLASGSYTVTPSNTGYIFTPLSQNVTVSAANVSGVNFTDNAAAVAPTIKTQPVNQTVTAGQAAAFVVVAAGTAPLSYQWQKNGVNIAGATSANYTTPATTSTDSGSTLRAVVTNTAGTVTSSAATLTVNAAPVAPTITTQPLNQTVTAGQTATFTVGATGTAPLTYQWKKSGTAISGATSSSYTTPVTTSSDNGAQFTVMVSNSAGNVTSNAATLTVGGTTPPLTISTTSLPAGMDGQGYSAQLNGTGGTAPYAWSVASGSLPAGLTLSSSGAISGVPSAAGTSTFSAKVTDMNLQTAQRSLSITTSARSVCAPTGSGVCYYVSPTGSDSNAGTSAAPFQTIQHAANVVNPGDMVIVRDGTYNNAAVSGVGSKLIVMSRGGTVANHVVFTAEHKWGAKIDGLNNTSATGWEFSANYIEVRNFECEGFSDTCMENYNGGSSSGGQFISITGNNIHDVGRYCTTTTTGRDGIFISNDNVTIEGNQIHDIGRGAPGEVLSGVTCVDSVNTLHYQNNDHGIYVDGAFTSANNLTIKNNVFYRDERGWSIQVYPAAVNNLRILNNTFLCPNPYRNGHITLSAPITNSAIENNISWEPTTGFLDYSNTTGYSNLSAANNLTYQGTVGAGTAPGGITLTGNLDNINPRLVSAPSCTVDAASIPDAHLQLGSPAIDMGLTLLDVPIDYDGTARPQGIRFDLGAFEYHP
jgi:hypothetical protein